MYPHTGPRVWWGRISFNAISKKKREVLRNASSRTRHVDIVCILDEYYSRDVLGAINASSIYVQTWFRISWLNDSPQCRAKAFCMAESEVADLSSPIAEVLAEIYRYLICLL